MLEQNAQLLRSQLFRMPFYQLIIDVPENNVSEFARSLRALNVDLQKDEGCRNFSAYRGFEDEKSFFLIGEFDSLDQKAGHFSIGYKRDHKTCCAVFQITIESRSFQSWGADHTINVASLTEG